MNAIKRLLGFAIPVVVVLAGIGLNTPSLANSGDGIKQRIGSRMVVDQLYRDILDRPANEEAYKLYGTALEEGKSPELVRKMIAFSPEAGLVINDHFRKFTGRDATEQEMQKVRKELNEGATISQLDGKLSKMGQKGKGKNRFGK
jgi:hypothetical protein